MIDKIMIGILFIIIVLVAWVEVREEVKLERLDEEILKEQEEENVLHGQEK